MLKSKNHFPTLGMSPEEIHSFYINRFKEKYEDKYDYSLIKENITMGDDEIKVICPEHGLIKTTPSKHLASATGCYECGMSRARKSKTLTEEAFKEKLDLLYPDRTWKLTGKYSKIKNPVIITDEDGFEHSIIANLLLLKKSSPTIKSAINQTAYIVNQFNKIHKNKFTYDNFTYTGALDYCTITCPIHGDIQTKPNWHLSGRGCNKCYGDNRSDAVKSNTREFIQKAVHVHGDLYTYNNVEYAHAKSKVSITCKVHGDFEQTPNSCLSGYGCPKCAVNGYKREGYVKSAKGRESCLYLIRVYNDDEEFYKVGITYMGLKYRYKRNMPYSYEPVYEIFSEAGNVWDIEKVILKKFYGYKYAPNIDFQGRTECFNISLPLDLFLAEVNKNKL